MSFLLCEEVHYEFPSVGEVCYAFPSVGGSVLKDRAKKIVFQLSNTCMPTANCTAAQVPPSRRTDHEEWTFTVRHPIVTILSCGQE